MEENCFLTLLMGGWEWGRGLSVACLSWPLAHPRHSHLFWNWPETVNICGCVDHLFSVTTAWPCWGDSSHVVYVLPGAVFKTIWMTTATDCGIWLSVGTACQPATGGECFASQHIAPASPVLLAFCLPLTKFPPAHCAGGTRSSSMSSSPACRGSTGKGVLQAPHDCAPLTQWGLRPTSLTHKLATSQSLKPGAL